MVTVGNDHRDIVPRACVVQSIVTTHCIITDVARRCTEVDDRGSLGTTLSEGVNMSHDIMTSLLLFCSSHLKINVLKVGLHLFDLLIADIKTKGLVKKKNIKLHQFMNDSLDNWCVQIT